MNARTGILMLLSLLLVGGASLASAALTTPHFITGIPALPTSYWTGHVMASAILPSPITASTPGFNGITPVAGLSVKPIHGGDFRSFVNPNWSVISTGDTSWADETPSSDSLNPFTYRAPPVSRCGL